MNIEDVVAVITGGASGLGKATAEYFLQQGARGVTILDVNIEAAKSLADELGDRALFVETDITNAEAVQMAVDKTVEKFGYVNVAVNAAGIAGPSKLLSRKGKIDMARVDMVLKVNLYGTLHVMRSAAEAMQLNSGNEDGERGLFINVSSGAAYEGQIGQIAYSASKAAVVGMTLPLARELGTSGIRVVTIAPGLFDTPIYDQMPAEVRDNIVNCQLFPKRFGKTSEFALFCEEVIRNPIHNGRTYRFDGGAILPATL